MSSRAAAGWRGYLLVTLTPWWGFFGLHALFAPPQIAVGTPIEVIPGWLRGGLWIGTAAYAVLAAVHPDRHPRALGWLMVMPCGRLASYAVQAVTHAVEEIVDRDVRWSGLPYGCWSGLPYGWWGLLHSVALYGLMARSVWTVSRIPGPTPVPAGTAGGSE